MLISRPTRAARVVAVLVAIVIGATLAGCASGGNGSGPNGAGPTSHGSGSGGVGSGSGGSSGAVLSSCSSYPGAKSCNFITVSATGAQAFHGTDTVPNQQICASVLTQNASANGGEVQLSAPVFLTGPTAAFNLFLDKYHGPGTYSLTGNDASIVFLIGATQYSATGAGAAISAVASADGSVSVSFTRLASGSDPTKTISGKAQFSCKNA